MTVEELQILITANTNDLRKEISKTNNTLGSLETTANRTNKGVMKSFKWLKTGIIALGIGALIKSITSGISGAIDRVDVLNNYGKTMSNLGIGAHEAQMSIDRLGKELIGLPTTLNDAALSVQRFTSANSNIKASTEMFLSLNNAILAGGAPIESQRSALEQLSQAYAKGKPDMFEWRAALQAMPAQLKQVATSMGYVSSDQLGEDLRNGTVSMNEFMTEIMKLNKEGIDGFENFETQARNATGGIATSITNMKTAITRGVADVMNAIGQANIAGFFNAITREINATIPYIVAFVKVTMMAVNWVASLFGKTSKGVKTVSDSVSVAKTSMGSLGNSSKDAAKGIDKTTGSAKKLKKELQGLAGFDDLHVMDQSADDSSAGGAFAGAGVDVGGLGGMDFDFGLDDQISSLGKVNDKVEAIMASWAKVGDFIKEHKNIIIATLGGIGVGLALFGTPIKTFILGTIELLKLWTGEMGILKGTFMLVADAIGITALTLGIIIGVVLAVVGAIVQLWQTNEGFRNNVMVAWSGIKETISGVYNTIIKPILESFKTMLLNIWEHGIKPLWDGWVEFVRSITEAMLEIWNVVLKPFVDWFVAKFGPIITTTFDLVSKVISMVMATIGQVIGTTFKVIATLVDGFVNIFKGIITFMTGVFTGDWKKAWEGVKAIFSGIVGTFFGVFKNVWNLIIGLFNSGGKIFDGIVGGINKIFVSVVNGLISGINRLIAAPFNTINGLMNMIRDFSILGARPFKGLWGHNPLPVPQIPRLPAYEKGTNMVPETGYALLHKGEEVKPAKQGKPYKDRFKDESDMVTLLIEMTALLKNIADKDGDVYMDFDKVGKVGDRLLGRRNKALGYG